MEGNENWKGKEEVRMLARLAPVIHVIGTRGTP